MKPSPIKSGPRPLLPLSEVPMLARRTRIEPSAQVAVVDLELASVQDRQSELAAFYGNFDRLTNLLQEAATYGPSPKLRHQYLELRAWMAKSYPAIRRYVVSFLSFEAEDSLRKPPLWGRPADAFEALVHESTLDQILSKDGASLSSRLIRTREALSQYSAHLGRLMASS